MPAVVKSLAIAILLFAADASAQGISVFQGSDGTSGTIVDLGGGLRSYSDSHGTTGTILDLGGGFQTYQFTSPQSGFKSGTILTFPSPRADVNAPPAGLTPAPVLPFFPKAPPMPREQAAPVTPFGSRSPYGTVGGYGAGRFGR
jgi:hypothetical protein